jgi:prepilin-type N-terminal cleavage/methylation domain-containing protein
MKTRRRSSSAFTLLELILVMLILSITAGMVVPSVVSFAVSQTMENSVQQVLDLARYAQTQSVADARTYRLNYDPQAGDVWLTAADISGTFQPLTSQFGQHVLLDKSIKMTVQVTVQPTVVPIVDPTITPNDVTPAPAFGQPVIPAVNSVLQLPRAQGTYTEFLSSGRVDPTLIEFVDRTGKSMSLGCATPLEQFHRLTKQEMQ